MEVMDKLEDQEEVFRQRGAVAVYLYGSYAEGSQAGKRDKVYIGPAGRKSPPMNQLRFLD